MAPRKKSARPRPPARCRIASTLEGPRVRVTARIPSGQRAILEQAAALVGSTLNQFVVQSAYEEARRTLVRETLIQLSQAAARKVLDLVDRPPRAGRRLKAAVRAYRESVRA